ncbi:unnamed protein product [Pleuronectes platessa]|uniref:Uncharacterized protein n=1 Tax=Pleuronectes platessa TaxID=8262 RepID=A0A9N7TRL6_PLEPL|nr:unnamed protein product [Pleuronectes platessa]
METHTSSQLQGHHPPPGPPPPSSSSSSSSSSSFISQLTHASSKETWMLYVGALIPDQETIHEHDIPPVTLCFPTHRVVRVENPLKVGQLPLRHSSRLLVQTEGF